MFSIEPDWVEKSGACSFAYWPKNAVFVLVAVKRDDGRRPMPVAGYGGKTVFVAVCRAPHRTFEKRLGDTHRGGMPILCAISRNYAIVGRMEARHGRGPKKKEKKPPLLWPWAIVVGWRRGEI